MNKVARKVHMQVSVWTKCFHFSLEIPRSGVSGPYGQGIFDFKKLPNFFFKVTTLFCIPVSGG